MELGEQAATFPLPGEVRFKIPKVLLETFMEEPRIVIKWRPDGIWPVDPMMLRDRLEALARDKEFMENYELVIMRKG